MYISYILYIVWKEIENDKARVCSLTSPYLLFIREHKPIHNTNNTQMHMLYTNGFVFLHHGIIPDYANIIIYYTFYQTHTRCLKQMIMCALIYYEQT